MNRLTALLDWIDDAAGALIRLAYLAAGVTAVAVYFGAGHLPGPVDSALNAGLPWALAFAVETHTYITARRVRASWQDMQASPTASDAHRRGRDSLRVNLAVLAGLLAFSAWNQLGYLASSGWRPGGTLIALPSFAAYTVRALVVPCAFMAAAFLAPLAEPISAQLEAEARATLADVFKIARKQRRRLLREAEASGRDMTGALVELVPDPDARRIIAHAYGAIRGEQPLAAIGAITLGTALAPPESPYTHAQEASGASPSEPPQRPPTGPGSPVRKRGVRTSRRQAPRRVLRLTPEPAEMRIRAVLEADPSASIKAIARQAHVGSSTASKWRGIVLAERAGQLAQ